MRVGKQLCELRNARGKNVVKKRLVALITVLCALWMLVGSGAGEASRLGAVSASGPDLCYSGCGGVYVPVQSAAYEQELVERINAERSGRGLPPLKRVAVLDDASRYHAADMALDDYFEHDSYDGDTRVCTWSERIVSYYGQYVALAENIAAGYSTPEAVLSAWMGSEGHRANILSEGVYELGVGYWAGAGRYGRYWVADFGRRAGVYPLIINQGASSTDARDVALYVYGEWSEIRLRNDGEGRSAWWPFSCTIDWTLARRTGTRTVYAEMRKGAQTASAEDSIQLELTGVALGDLPDRLTFVGSVVDGAASPGARVLIIENTVSHEPMQWTASSDAPWLHLSETTGNSPGSLWVVPQLSGLSAPGTLHGQVVITATGSGEVWNSPQVLDVTLHLVAGQLQRTWTPLVVRQ